MTVIYICYIMGRISIKSVREKLSKKDNFSVFIYFKNGKIIYDTELKAECIGVLSTDIFSMLKEFASDGCNEENLIDLQIANAQNQSEFKKEYGDEKKVSEVQKNRLLNEGNGQSTILVNDLEKAKSFCDEAKMTELLIKIFKDLMDNCGFGDTEIVEDADIHDDFGADSLTVIEFVMKIEEELGISIPDDVTETIFFSKKEFRTLRWIALFLVQQINTVIKLSEK